ncbi:MAG: DegV family protein [Mycoplasmoidaceae bacterium]
MQKVGFIVDGSSTLTDAELKEKGIRRISFKIVEDDVKTYNDDLKEITYEQISAVHASNKFLKTSCSALGEVMEAIDEELKVNDYVLIFAISKAISSQYSSIKMLEQEPEYKGKLFVIDTQAQCYGVEYILLESIKMIKEGKTVQEVVKFAEEQNEYIYTLFVSESSKPATASGRLAKVMIGRVLDKAKFTPIFYMNQKIGLSTIATSYKKAIEKMVTKTKKILDENGGAKKFISVYTSLCDESWKDYLIQQIMKQFKIDEKEIIIKKTPLIIFTNTGKNSFGLALGLKKKYVKD